jgi:hypothetical protein
MNRVIAVLARSSANSVFSVTSVAYAFGHKSNGEETMMDRPLPTAPWQILILTLVCTATCAAPVHAVPVFYLSTQSTGASPGLLNLINVTPNTMGTLHIWVGSDVRLSGVSLDLVETGGAIKFTGLDVPNPNRRWVILDGPQEITNSAVNHIGGAAIPGFSGNGIGQGSPEGANVLLASVNYMTLNDATSQISLRVGHFLITDWTGITPLVKFGSPTAPDVPGGVPGGMGAVGSISVEGSVPLPPVVVDSNLGNRLRGSTIDHTFTTSHGDSPITWDNLLVSGTGTPAIPPTLTPGGAFTWDSTGSPLGQYNFDVTATNATGSDVGRLSLNLIAVPEPATTTLTGVAILAFFGLVRCKG